MNRQRVQMAITGPEVSPERVYLRQLIEILSRIERAVVSYAKTKLADVPEDAISLVGIESGSDCLSFLVAQPVIPAVAQISQAIKNQDYADLPHPTYEELYGLSKSLTERGWGFEIREDLDYDIYEARIDADNAIEPPRTPARLKGTTTIHGRCLRVGGATKPKAEVRISTTEEILNVDLTEETAKELAKHLYDQVVLEGTALWNTETWNIERFHVTEVTTFHQTDPALAFKELAQASGGNWDGVNAEEYVQSLRDDE